MALFSGCTKIIIDNGAMLLANQISYQVCLKVYTEVIGILVKPTTTYFSAATT